VKKVTDDKTHACISMLIRLHFCDKVDFLDWEIKLFRLIIICWEVNLNTKMWWEVTTQKWQADLGLNQQMWWIFRKCAKIYCHIDYAFSWISVKIWLILQPICFTSSTLASNQEVVPFYCFCMCFVTPIIHIAVSLHAVFTSLHTTGNRLNTPPSSENLKFYSLRSYSKGHVTTWFSAQVNIHVKSKSGWKKTSVHKVSGY